MTHVGNTTGGVRAVKAFKILSLDRTSINCQVGRRFKGTIFSEIRDFSHFDYVIHSVGLPVSDHQDVRLTYVWDLLT
jgi:hypothetical protein